MNLDIVISCDECSEEISYISSINKGTLVLVAEICNCQVRKTDDLEDEVSALEDKVSELGDKILDAVSEERYDTVKQQLDDAEANLLIADNRYEELKRKTNVSM